MVQIGAGHLFAGLRESGGSADGPIDEIVHIGVRKRGARFGLIPQTQHMVGDRIAAHGHVPVIGFVGVVENRTHAVDLRRHHVFRTVSHIGGYGVGGGFECGEVEIVQSEQAGVRAEHTLDDGLIAFVRANKGEVLGDEKSQRLAWAEHHRAQKNLEGDVRIVLEQIRGDPCRFGGGIDADLGLVYIALVSQVFDDLIISLG